MPEAPRIAEDPFTAQGGGIEDRPSVHDALRSAGPVVQVEAPAGGPAWVITEDGLAREVLADPRFAKDPGLAPAHWHAHDPGLEPPASQVRSLTTLDGVEHRQLRVHAPAFARRRILAERDRITTIARDLLTELAEDSARTGQPADLVARFVTRYPLMAIGELLGIPLADVARAARATEAMTSSDTEQVWTGFMELEAMVAAAIRASHEGNTATLTDALTERARAELGDVSDDEFLYMITGLVFAGQVTTESFPRVPSGPSPRRAPRRRRRQRGCHRRVRHRDVPAAPARAVHTLALHHHRARPCRRDLARRGPGAGRHRRGSTPTLPATLLLMHWTRSADACLISPSATVRMPASARNSPS